jgi:hypothetical protein
VLHGSANDGVAQGETQDRATLRAN